jgi:hypothetical protein
MILLTRITVLLVATAISLVATAISLVEGAAFHDKGTVCLDARKHGATVVGAMANLALGNA